MKYFFFFLIFFLCTTKTQAAYNSAVTVKHTLLSQKNILTIDSIDTKKVLTDKSMRKEKNNKLAAYILSYLACIGFMFYGFLALIAAVAAPFFLSITVVSIISLIALITLLKNYKKGSKFNFFIPLFLVNLFLIIITLIAVANSG